MNVPLTYLATALLGVPGRDVEKEVDVVDALALLFLQAALPPARVARAARGQVLLGHDELAALGLHASVLAELGGNPIDNLLGL